MLSSILLSAMYYIYFYCKNERNFSNKNTRVPRKIDGTYAQLPTNICQSY